MKCIDKECTGQVSDGESYVALQTGCHSYTPAYPCEKCGRLYFKRGEKPASVKNRQGKKVFYREGKIVLK